MTRDFQSSVPPGFSSPIIVALDYASRSEALAFAHRVSPNECRLKIGKEMFTRFGPDFVRDLQRLGFDIFLDLKFHDIPNTVAKAVSAAAELGVWMVNVHAGGGERMMAAAKEALAPFGAQAPKLIAVTLLTSMADEDLTALGIPYGAFEYAGRLADLARRCGLDGVVCSAREAAVFKQRFGAEFLLVTPGIRPEGSDAGDQRRVLTPVEALRAGVDYMVIGRPITRSQDPAVTLQGILMSLRDMGGNDGQ
ncbi:orotidine-5'-phosphate decarboxylase [Sodalis ligni]|uniref:orotidine-5'-phosphate decarboxylase n=1 Tax=Sodalis ligni TaxID=2697027 RepID=UPI00193F4A10|nr:orotidine-5'-phosphate decarboxylase [Sodalis ligni]QWA08905.1 orotidine-5'-phosphate decarboxylase [Sodalis ligni]